MSISYSLILTKKSTPNETHWCLVIQTDWGLFIILLRRDNEIKNNLGNVLLFFNQYLCLWEESQSFSTSITDLWSNTVYSSQGLLLLSQDTERGGSRTWQICEMTVDQITCLKMLTVWMDQQDRWVAMSDACKKRPQMA